MSAEDSIAVWIKRLRDQDEQAAQELWQRYFEKLVALAGKRLPGHVKRSFDEEDVALSAFHSLCRGVQANRFPDLEDRDNLWALLVVITARKAMSRIRENTAVKRGSGKVHGESVFGTKPQDIQGGINRMIGDTPTPEFALEVCEESDRLMSELPDDSFRDVALLKFAGYTNEEIAQKTGQSTRTVRRRLNFIRTIWGKDDASGG